MIENETEFARRHLPSGWRVAVSHANEDAGILVTVERFNKDTRIMEWRKVWIDSFGDLTWDAEIDGRGYIRAPNGRDLNPC